MATPHSCAPRASKIRIIDKTAAPAQALQEHAKTSFAANINIANIGEGNWAAITAVIVRWVYSHCVEVCQCQTTPTTY